MRALLVALLLTGCGHTATLQAIHPPAEVIAWGGLQAPGTTLDRATTLAQSIVPAAPPLAPMARMALSRMAESAADRFDWSRPIVFMVTKSGLRVAFHATPGGEVPRTAPLANGMLMLSFVPSGAASDETALKVSFEAMAAAPQTGDFTVAFNWDWLVANHKSDVIGFFDQMASIDTTPQGRRIAPMFRGLGERLVEDTRAFWLVSDIATDGVSLRIGHEARPDTKTAELYTGNAPASAALLSELPKDVVAAGIMDWEENSVIVDMLGTMFSWMSVDADEATIERMKTLNRRMLSLATEGAMALHGVDGGGLAATMLYAVDDADEFREVMRKLWGATKSIQIPGLEQLFRESAYEVAGVPVDVGSQKWTDPAMEDFGSFLGDTHLAVKGNRAVLLMGNDNKPRMKAWFAGRVARGAQTHPGMARALEKALPNASFVGFMDLVGIFQRLELGGMNPLRTFLEGVDGGPGISFSARSDDGTGLLQLEIPLATVKAFFMAFLRG